MDINRVFAYRLFLNKIWQAFRFAISRIDPNHFLTKNTNIKSNEIHNQWILHQLNKMKG